MPAVASIDNLLDVVRKSQLVDDGKLNNYLQRQALTGDSPDDPTQFAAVMVRDALITTFQAKQLLNGRWRRFVIGSKYRVLDLLGQGGMGAVYLCEHSMMKRLVALKVLPQDKLSQPGALERFKREARAIAGLDHPNIVHAYDMGQDNDLYFMVMEYVDGPSFEQLITKHYKTGTFDETRAANYISQAALGLGHAHEAGWVHRDMKPGNILVDRQGIVKILDLGLSRLFAEDDEQLTKRFDGGSVLGTADYIAPEQALNVSMVDVRADIYGLGATFYYILTGRPPFDKGTIAQKLLYHQTREPDPIRSVRPDLSIKLALVVAKMMAKDPAQRFQTPADVVEALGPWTQGVIPPPPEHEMPVLCPMVRELLPNSTVVPSRPSSPRVVLPPANAKMAVKPTAKAGAGSGPRRVPEKPRKLPIAPRPQPAPPTPAEDELETVVDRDRQSSDTPRNMPSVVEAMPAAPGAVEQRQQRRLMLYAAGGGAAVIVLVVVVLFAVFWNSSSAKRPGVEMPMALESAPASAPKKNLTKPKAPITPEQAKEYKDSNIEVTVDMKVKSVQPFDWSGGKRWLLYGDTNLLINIDPTVEKVVADKMESGDLMKLKGKTIRVRGWVYDYNNNWMQILVTNADWIEQVGR